jgi:flagellar basal-body rod protein FlgB
MGLFDGSSFKLVEQGLDASWYKQKVISNNIANVDTYNFKAKTVNFGIVLDKALGKNENGSEEPYVKVETTCEENTVQTLNGNNVDMEKETLALADAQYQYSSMIDYMNAQYKMIRTAIGK